MRIIQGMRTIYVYIYIYVPFVGQEMRGELPWLRDSSYRGRFPSNALRGRKSERGLRPL